MTLLLTYFLVAIAVSFLCSILEAVLLSMTPSFVTSLQQQGRKSALLLADMKRNIDRPLAAILSLNTIAHTAGAAGVGAQAQVVFGSASLTLVSAILTLLILVLSEIIPKTLGAMYWRAFAVPTVYVTRLLVILLYPLVLLSKGITHILARGRVESSLNRDEIKAIAEIGRQEGVLDQAESDALLSVVQFHTIKVKDVLTPRVVTVTWPADMTVGEVMAKHTALPFSRVPLVGQNHDEIIGYVLKDDVLTSAARSENSRTLRELSRRAMVVPESALIRRLLRQFLKAHEHIAIVVDEFGGFAGVVTLEDIIETLIGREIMDEIDEVEDMRELARERRQQSGGTHPPTQVAQRLTAQPAEKRTNEADGGNKFDEA